MTWLEEDRGGVKKEFKRSTGGGRGGVGLVRKRQGKTRDTKGRTRWRKPVKGTKGAGKKGQVLAEAPDESEKEGDPGEKSERRRKGGENY